jgi:hypothetical protein
VAGEAGLGDGVGVGAGVVGPEEQADGVAHFSLCPGSWGGCWGVGWGVLGG